MIKTEVRRLYVTMDEQHPYPGLYAFRETESEYFYGRTRETKELVNLIQDNVLTVVFGKSGVGKTSLLRAGLMPKLRENYFLPIYLRLNFGDKRKPPLVYQVKDTILKKVQELEPDAKPFYDLTLWEYFSTVKILNGYVKPLLFFDQFEEMFTTGKDNLEKVNEFITEMADLIENRVPVAVQEKMKKEKKPMADTQRGPEFRVVFSLREDYLPQLEMLYKYIPSLRFSRYRVSQLQGKDALEAVLKPGKEIIKDPEVGIEIIKKIPGAKGADYKPYENVVESWETKKIEPFLLSLFCYQVNEKRLDANEKEISGHLIKDISTEDIIKDYYEENINRFEPNVKIAIEDLLLTEEGYRKLQDINSLKTGYGVEDKDIEELINRRIIRKETRIDIEYIELIHDVLTPILKESRDKRKEEERRKKELAERKKKYSRIIMAVVGVAAIFLALLAVYAFQQKSTAERERAKAEKESLITKAYELAAYSTNLLDKDPTLSFRLAESAYRTEKTNPGAYNALLHSYYSGDFYAIFKHDDPVKAAGFSPDGTYIITIDQANTTRYWNFNGEEMKPAAPPYRNIEAKSRDTSPDGKKIIIAGGPDKTAELKDLDGNVLRVFKGHTDNVQSAAFSPDGKYIVTASDDHTARLWNLTFTGNRPRVFSGHRSERSDFLALFSHDGDRLLTVNSEKVVLWKWDVDVNHNIPQEIVTNPGYKPVAAFAPDGKTIAVTGPEEKTIRLLDMDGQLVRTIGEHQGANSVAFSPGSDKIIIACSDKTACLWELQSGKSQVFNGHDQEVNSAVFSPDGKFVVTASWDKTARLWDLQGEEIKKFIGHEKGVNSAVFSNDGTTIVTASMDGTARLWDLEGNCITIFEGHTGAVTSARFSPDGKYVITASDDRTARLWDLHGTQVFKFKEFNDVIHTASFSPDGKYVLIAPAHGPAQMRMVNPEEIIRSVNERNVWQLDAAAKKKYNL